MNPLLQAAAALNGDNVLSWVLGLVATLASAVASVAAIAWKSRGDQIASLQGQVAALQTQLDRRDTALIRKDDLVNEVRNAQLAELRTNLLDSNRNLNAATQAIVGSTNVLESQAELEDKILQIAQQNNASLEKTLAALDRIERNLDRRAP